MTVPTGQAFDESAHLSIKDIAVDDAKHPSMIPIRISQRQIHSGEALISSLEGQGQHSAQ